MTQGFESIDDYIASFPDNVQVILNELRHRIRTVAPGCQESMRYQMPTFTVDGRHPLYVAAWKHHIGLYPIPRFDGPLEDQVAPYRAAKDTVRFVYKKPIPYDLVEQFTTSILVPFGKSK